MSKQIKARSLRVLHLASFSGNIGDVANHAGSYYMFHECLSFDFSFTQLEIREFYWGRRKFDDKFVDYANTYDLVVIGGGNYFELWVENSATGTSIDISPYHLSRIRVPLVFFSLGVDIGQGYSETTADRFKSFIQSALARPDIFLSIRNDGSSRALADVLGTEISSRIPSLPDGGFFAYSPQPPISPGKANKISVNIAGDMLQRRFTKNFGPDGFLKSLATVFQSLVDSYPALVIELVPHIWRDVSFIGQLFEYLPDPFLRRNVLISPFEPQLSGLAGFFHSYASSDIVLGMRFHANVCPLGMGVPTRGLFCYPQIKLLYEELHMSDRIIDVRANDFSGLLIESVHTDLQDISNQRQRCIQLRADLYSQARDTLSGLDKWLLGVFS